MNLTIKTSVSLFAMQLILGAYNAGAFNLEALGLTSSGPAVNATAKKPPAADTVNSAQSALSMARPKTASVPVITTELHTRSAQLTTVTQNPLVTQDKNEELFQELTQDKAIASQSTVQTVQDDATADDNNNDASSTNTPSSTSATKSDTEEEHEAPASTGVGQPKLTLGKRYDVKEIAKFQVKMILGEEAYKKLSKEEREKYEKNSYHFFLVSERGRFPENPEDLKAAKITPEHLQQAIRVADQQATAETVKNKKKELAKTQEILKQAKEKLDANPETTLASEEYKALETLMLPQQIKALTARQYGHKKAEEITQGDVIGLLKRVKQDKDLDKKYQKQLNALSVKVVTRDHALDHHQSVEPLNDADENTFNAAMSAVKTHEQKAAEKTAKKSSKSSHTDKTSDTASMASAKSSSSLASSAGSKKDESDTTSTASGHPAAAVPVTAENITQETIDALLKNQHLDAKTKGNAVKLVEMKKTLNQGKKLSAKQVKSFNRMQKEVTEAEEKAKKAEEKKQLKAHEKTLKEAAKQQK